MAKQSAAQRAETKALKKHRQEVEKSINKIVATVFSLPTPAGYSYVRASVFELSPSGFTINVDTDVKIAFEHLKHLSEYFGTTNINFGSKASVYNAGEYYGVELEHSQYIRVEDVSEEFQLTPEDIL